MAMHHHRCLFPLAVVALSILNPLAAQNDKQVIGDAVFTPEEIANGATITYFIRFQNVGLDTAEQVVVRDTLDPRLDPTTFDMVAASHDYELLREGTGDVIRWYFNDIILPDSASDEPGSLGFVLFTVQPKAFLAPGQVIVNQACITFQNNNTVCTNEAFVWIDDGANTEEPTAERDLRIVPNPNQGQFEVRHYEAAGQPAPADTDAEWWITDLHGKTVWDGSATSAAAVGNLVLLERPSPGLYLLWVKENGRLQVEQFAVVR